MPKEADNSKLTLTIVILIVSVGLMIWGALVERDNFTTWQDTEIPCLIGGHDNVETQITTHVRILVDGEKKDIPSGVGVGDDCMAQVHTHDGSGEVRVEAAVRDPDITLADFFSVWGKPLSITDYDRRVYVNGSEITNAPSYQFTDGDQVEIHFRSAGASSSATSTTSR